MKGLAIGIGVILLAGAILAAAYFAGVFPDKSDPGEAPAEETAVEEESPAEETEAPAEEEPALEIFTVTVQGDEYRFSPSTVTVPRGSRVRLTFMNVGSLAHNYTISSLGVSTSTINPGQSATVEFDAPDSSTTFQAVCTVIGHSEAGMVGTLVVE